MHLKEATQGLAQTVPGLKTSLTNLNAGLNALAFNPAGSAESFMFYLPWLNHNINNMFLLQDAHGPLRRGIVLQTCQTASNAQSDRRRPGRSSRRSFEVTNVPTRSEIC